MAKCRLFHQLPRDSTKRFDAWNRLLGSGSSARRDHRQHGLERCGQPHVDMNRTRRSQGLIFSHKSACWTPRVLDAQMDLEQRIPLLSKGRGIRLSSPSGAASQPTHTARGAKRPYLVQRARALSLASLPQRQQVLAPLPACELQIKRNTPGSARGLADPGLLSEHPLRGAWHPVLERSPTVVRCPVAGDLRRSALHVCDSAFGLIGCADGGVSNDLPRVAGSRDGIFRKLSKVSCVD